MTNPGAPSEDWANALKDFVDEIGGDGPGLWKWAGITPTPKEVVDELRLLFKHSEQRATASGARSVLKFDPQDSDESIRLAWGDMTPDQAVKGLKALVGHLNGLAAPPVPQTSAPGAEFLRPTMDEVMGLAKTFGVEVNDCHALMWLVVTSIAAWGDGPETPSTAPVAWCRSDDFLNALLKQQSFSGWREQHPNCDMALYAQPQASAAQPTGPSLKEVGTLIAWLTEKATQAADTGASRDAGMLTWAAQVVGERVDEDAPDADRAEGPSLADVAELCTEFGFHVPDDEGRVCSKEVLRDMITAALTRWRAPVVEPVAAQDTEVDWESMTARMDFGMAKPSKPEPVNLATLHDPNFKPNFLRYEFSVHDENDQEVASGDADTFAEVAAQGCHYFAQSMDDQLRVEFRCVQTMDCSKAIS